MRWWSTVLNEAQKVAIRYLTPPEGDREMTLAQFAASISVTPRAIQKWQKDNREFAAALEKSREAYASDPDWYDGILRFHAKCALLKGAQQDAKTRDEIADKRACIKQLLEITKHVAENRDKVDMSAYTDRELLEMALSGGLDIDGIDLSGLKGELE